MGFLPFLSWQEFFLLDSVYQNSMTKTLKNKIISKYCAAIFADKEVQGAKENRRILPPVFVFNLFAAPPGPRKRIIRTV